MNPEDQLVELLRLHDFGLVRHGKHKIYRNPDGLTYVNASTPSDRRASRNALATLKRLTRHLDRAPAPADIAQPAPEDEVQSTIQVIPMVEPTPAVAPESAPLSDGEWEAWKRRYWHDEKLRAKNERFLSDVSTYVGRIGDLRQQGEHEHVNSGPASEALRSILRDMGYKSKIVLYTLKAFEKGIIVYEKEDEPVVWASNNHIGISAFVILNVHVQHGTSRPDVLRFEWDGIPVLFERPEKGARKFYAGSQIE
jgi:hypothetical protein